MMNTVKRYLKFAAVHTAILIAVALFGTALINTSPFDEPPLPAVVELEVADDSWNSMENTYPALFGLGAANGLDPHQVGVQLIDLLNSKAAEGALIRFSDEEHQSIHGRADLDDAWRAVYSKLSCTPRLSHTCIEVLIEQIADIPITNARLVLMIQRYDDVVQKVQFNSNHQKGVETQLPAYSLVLSLGKMKLAQHYVQGDLGRFLDALSADMRFWRMVLRDGETILAKMVAAVGLRNDLQFLSALIANHHLDGDQQSRVRQLTARLSPEELDIGEGFAAEQQVFFREIDRYDRGIRALTIQPQASKNAYYQTQLLPMLLASKLSAKELIEQHTPAQQPQAQQSFPSLYNISGRSLLHMTYFGFQDYIGRIHDLNGIFALVALQLEIKTNSAVSAQQLVNQSVHRNPYNGETMDFSAEQGELSFECFSPSESCRISIL